MGNTEYLEEKRLEVLKEIKPICDAFGIKDYEYEVSDKGQREILLIEGTKIGCSCNSVYAVKQELIGWIFLAMWRQRSLGAFENQTKKIIKQYWLEG
jgi:hypothetical protein